MKLKVLFVAFLCLFSAPIIYNAAMVTLSTPEAWSFQAFANTIQSRYFITNGTEPTGDPIGGGGWPR